ncbi:MAG TPA: hypothetical protein VFU59_04130 [Candidatus Eisenbacteria bacterium]|nr:hypothetical protein [Candidatus Eisenbacteria bacterium]
MRRGVAAFFAVLLGALVAAPSPAGPVEDAAAVTDAAAAADSLRSGGAALPTPQPAEWETLALGLPEEYRLGPIVGFRYNRVDGPAPTAGLAVRNEEHPLPLLRAQATYAFSRERLLAEFGADVPVGHGRPVTLGGSVYRRTFAEDAWIVSEMENTLFALLSRKDYLDYYEAEGFEGHLSIEPGRDAGLSAGARIEDHRSLDVETRVAAWGVDDLFRANPAIEPGEEGLVWGAVRVGPATLPSKGGSRVIVRYERAGGPIERDFDYGRVRLQANVRRRLAPDQSFRARAILGSTRSGRLPAQKVWELGGIGTLRGEPFQSHRGDQFYLVNAEYYYLFRKNLHALVFLDWGTAWFGRGAWRESRPALDGGVGVRVAEGPLAVTLSRNLQRSDAPFLVGVRLGGAWE